MTEDVPIDTLSVGIRIEDPLIATRLRELLGQTPGLRVAAGGEQPDLILSVAAAEGNGDLDPLTPRERDVLALLAEGLSNRAIATRLGIAADTAKFHVSRVIDKLDATGRTDAVAHAVRRGVIHL